MRHPIRILSLPVLALALASCDSGGGGGSTASPGGDPVVVGDFTVTTTYDHVDTLPTVALKTLEGQLKQGPVAVTVKNGGSTPAAVTVSVGIQDYTSAPGVTTVTIPAGGSHEFDPILFLDPSKLPGLTTLTPSNYQVKVTVSDNGTDKTVFGETHPVWLMARDAMPWTWAGQAMTPYVSLFVTPTDSAVQDFLGTALKYAPGKSFIGYQQNGVDSAEETDTAVIPAGQTVALVPAVGRPMSLALEYSSSAPISLILQDTSGEVLVQTPAAASMEPNSLPYAGGQWSIQNPGTTDARIIVHLKAMWATTNPGAGSVHDQVEAIYEALHDRGITYSNTTLSFPAGSQKIRFPQDALHQAAANCIDGTVLMASALEAIGIEPLIVMVPGHAFLGWRDAPGSPVVEFVETTMIGSQSFATATAYAMSEYYTAEFADQATVVDVTVARTDGLLPAARKLIP
jgi:hypothetical protein